MSQPEPSTRPAPRRRRRSHARFTVAALVACALFAAACQSGPRGPYSPVTEGARDTDKAQRLTREAAAIIDAKPAKAESLLREALDSDLYFGPAHNNLGVLYLRQGKLYEAAGEFEWARKLMPGHPDPRINLALVFEKAGRVDDALGAYASALEVYPQHLQATEGLVRLQIRSGRTDDRTLAMLNDVALRGEGVQWREWAVEQRLRLSAHGSPQE